MIIAITHTKRKGEEAVKINRRQINHIVFILPGGGGGKVGDGRRRGGWRARDGEERAQTCSETFKIARTYGSQLDLRRVVHYYCDKDK
jgi:hypothetical protein